MKIASMSLLSWIYILKLMLQLIRQKKINTGICISLPENVYMSIKNKSSLASKGLSTIGGFIDKNYSNEIS